MQRIRLHQQPAALHAIEQLVVTDRDDCESHEQVRCLVGVEQLSYQEAAEVLGVPTGTVMSRLARARERLRRSLGGPRLERVK